MRCTRAPTAAAQRAVSGALTPVPPSDVPEVLPITCDVWLYSPKPSHSLPQTRVKKIKWDMVLLFSAMGILLWIAVLLAVLVLCGIVWLFCRTMVWLTGLTHLVTHPNVAVASRQNIPPVPKPALRVATPDLIPKWNAAHRRYVDRDMADWQQQFDALNSRK